ncbi:MAG: hypothetical protein H8E32_04565 [Nitrospinae bacterium]|nr:hypothetical protein [Nitrospinota bacterium]
MEGLEERPLKAQKNLKRQIIKSEVFFFGSNRLSKSGRKGFKAIKTPIE